MVMSEGGLARPPECPPERPRNALTGFSIVKADGMDAALEMARACPFPDFGTVEVAEVMEMK